MRWARSCFATGACRATTQYRTCWGGVWKGQVQGGIGETHRIRVGMNDVKPHKAERTAREAATDFRTPSRPAQARARSIIGRTPLSDLRCFKKNIIKSKGWKMVGGR